MARQQAAATSWALRIAGRIVKDQNTGWDSNPRRRITGAESSPLDYQCLFHSVGSEGLEPSPTWLRARHAATSTLIPCSCFVSRYSSARNVGADGVEPST